MADYSAHYNLIMLGPGENLSEDGYAFTKSNIQNLDTKAYLGAEGHRHTGVSAVSADPANPLSVHVVANTGSIPGGRTVRYKYTLVDQYGQESAPSPEAIVNTPNPVASPGAPTLVRTLDGTLLPGNYFYMVTAYRGANTLETTPGARAYTTINFGDLAKSVDVRFPSTPSGTDGFNIYRRSPGSTRFQWLAAVAVNVATPPTSYLDDGSVAEDCNRTVPARNTTGASNAVSISLPGATPSVPDGYTWKIYRTYTNNEWDSSLLHWTVEETSEGSGIIVSSYTDIGQTTVSGKYPEHSQIAGSPDQIQLNDMAEVQGTLPVGSTIIPTTVTFTFAGPLAPESGTFLWVSEYDKAQIISARAYLGNGSTPAVQPVIVDVNKYDANSATPGWSSIFADTASRPRVALTETIGAAYTLDVADTQILLKGDALSVDIDQAGGGATPTDANLVVSIVLYTDLGSKTVSHVWADA